MTSIDQLLAQRSAKRGNKTGNKERAYQRSSQSRYLAEHFSYFDEVRPHLFQPQTNPTIGPLSKASDVLSFLDDQGWITRKNQHAWKLSDDPEVRSYLSGGWLEEYVYLAHVNAGADEAYFGQEIEWEVNGVHGNNEIDVIARRGSLLSFTSCKTIKVPKGSGHSEQLRGFLSEADYWNIHFADDAGRALLVTTADYYDEQDKGKHRYPSLVARSQVLNVVTAGVEDLPWPHLIQKIANHWSS